MNTQLTDFTNEQLEDLLFCVANEMANIERATPSNIEEIIDPRYDNLSLWQVQILTAIGIVGRREQIANN